MGKCFQLDVVTADSTVFSGQVDALNLPTPFGSVGILAEHAPMLCAVAQGILRATLTEGGLLRIRVGDGVANVADNEATVLLSRAEILDTETDARTGR
ncbi:MAG: F0F1 ATP synthase subunit epsilon [Oscillospiraceae bacterium]|nr:F0F1 ATP synthase subunit epsilon [Oscillospiraceae bacterium]